MKSFSVIILLLLSVEVSAERFGNWEYFIPEDSPFSLNPIDNGLYLQFTGQITFTAQIAVTLNRNGEAYILHAVPDEEVVAKLPYRKIGNIQRPIAIHLLGNDEFLSSLNLTEQNEPLGQEKIVGVAKITINGFQSSADCGKANFFAFENYISDFEYADHYENYESPRC